MDNKKIVIIGVLLLIIVGVILLILLNTANYEKIEITPNGTSIEVPANQTEYRGEVSGIKIWNWDKGVLITYNSHEDSVIKVGQLSFNTINELIDNSPMEEADGFTCHVINADELLEISIFDIVKLNYNGKLYCISTSNSSSQDNIIICCDNKDMAVHMANSIVYKNVYPNDSNSNSINLSIDSNTINSTIDTITEEIQSKSPIKL